MRLGEFLTQPARLQCRLPVPVGERSYWLDVPVTKADPVEGQVLRVLVGARFQVGPAFGSGFVVRKIARNASGGRTDAKRPHRG